MLKYAKVKAVLDGLAKSADIGTYVSNYAAPVLGGAAIGATAGFASGKKGKRTSRAILGGLLGAYAGGAARYIGSGGTISDMAKLRDADVHGILGPSERVPMFSDWRPGANETRSAIREWTDAVQDPEFIDALRNPDFSLPAEE